MEAGPSREDVIFGRALIAFRLATKEQVEACVQDQRRLAAQGRAMTLAQVMVGRKVLSVEQYQKVAKEIQARLVAQAQVRTGVPGGAPFGAAPIPQAPVAAPPVLLPPGLTQSGRYHNLLKEAGITRDGQAQEPPPSDDEIEEAAKQWEQASAEKEPGKPAPDPTATSAARRRGAGAPPAAAPNADPGIEVVPDDTPNTAQKLTTPQAAKERRDAGIRKMLGVPEDAQEFDFGPYRILGEVAAGGMGIIYRARETATNSVYALKALLNVESANEKQLKRFIQEAQSAMRLDHGGIVKIYDLGVFENIPYFTMDMVPGKDLHHLLRDKAVTTEEALRLLVKVCDAVHYAHTQGVIHRDLKPANIIVRPDGTPILTDFGLAKNLDSQFKLTAEGAMVGTPLYLSPEQVSGKANLVDARCDVYGLGVMLYQILTDRLPFFGRNPYEVYRKVTEEDPTPPTQINPAISPEIEKICLMALAKSKEERFESAEAMGKEIGRFLKGEKVNAKIPTPAKGGRGGAKAAAVTAAAAAAGGGGSQRALYAIVAALVLVIVGGIGYLIYAAVSGS